MAEYEKLWCPDGEHWVIPVEGVTSLHQHGHQWCAVHCKVDEWCSGKPIVASRSLGKLLSPTKTRRTE